MLGYKIDKLVVGEAAVKSSEIISREMKRGGSQEQSVEVQAKQFLTFRTPGPKTRTAPPSLNPFVKLQFASYMAPWTSRGTRHLIATTTFGPKSSLWLGAGAVGRWLRDERILSGLVPLLWVFSCCCCCVCYCYCYCYCFWSGHSAIFQHFRNKIFNNSPRRPLSASTFKLPAVASGRASINLRTSRRRRCRHFSFQKNFRLSTKNYTLYIHILYTYICKGRAGGQV